MKVLWLCLLVSVFLLIGDGSLFRLWNLYNDQQKITESLKSLEKNSRELARQMQKASDPDYLEHQARERLDLAGDNELIFVFSE